MAACPRCARPVAVSGARCLYCGAGLEAAQTTAPLEALPPAEPRRLVVVEQGGAPAAALVAALGLSPVEAARRSERGGLHLVRVAQPSSADDEAARLAAAGIRAWLLDEADVRAGLRPLFVRGGARVGEGVGLLLDEATRHVGPGDVLLAVRGPIQREYQATPAGRTKIRAASLAEGYRAHLHLREGGPPLELDPGDFAFTEPADAAAPSLLVLAAWMDALQAPVDDEFRRLTPALGAAVPAAGALAVADALRPARGPDARLVLDNVAQFRFYSAWRGLVERQRGR